MNEHAMRLRAPLFLLAAAGDQFAIFESVTALAMLVRRFDFAFAPDAPPVSMTTGATIHTTNGLWLCPKPRADLEEVRQREAAAAQGGSSAAAVAHGEPAAAGAASAAGGCPLQAAAAAAAAVSAQPREAKEATLASVDG